MPTFYDSIDTTEGVAHILTKTRWVGIVPMPRTSVMPHRGGELRRLGTAIRWTTKDAATLRTLHGRVLELVQQFGLSGIREIATTARMTDRVAKTFGGTWQDIVKQAAQDDAPFPIPNDVLRYIKSFV